MDRQNKELLSKIEKMAEHCLGIMDFQVSLVQPANIKLAQATSKIKANVRSQLKRVYTTEDLDSIKELLADVKCSIRAANAIATTPAKTLADYS